MQASDLNREYAEYDRRMRINNARIASILVITLVPFGALLDWFVYPQFLIPFLGLRIGCSVATAVAWGLLRSRFQNAVYPYLIHAWYLFPTLTMCCMIGMSEGAVSSYYAGLNLVILAVSVVMQTSLKESLLSVGTIFGIYIIACLFYGPVHNSAALFSNFYFLALTAIIVLIGNHNYNRLRFQEFVLRHQLGESRRKLEQNNLQLRELDEAKSRFFANISHELRTPLTLIASPIEKLRQSNVIRQAPDLYQLTSIMEANSLRLLRMINNLLDLVRVESAEHSPIQHALSIDELLKGIFNSVEHVAQAKGINLVSDYEPNERPVLLDQDRMEKIVLNLLLNAIKFTPAGGRVSLIWQMTEQDLTVEVIDTGIGISPDDLDHIFDRFWQANTSSTRKFQGVGIGLALVKELAESMGGAAQVKSQLNGGSTFTIKLPVTFSAAALPPAPATPATPAIGRGSDEEEWLSSLYRRADLFIEAETQPFTTDHVELSRRKRPLVLIGEDQPDMAAFIASQLKDDFDILIAADGQYAIDMSRQYKPDLLVLDLMMPEKDGLEVCRALESEVKARGLPILMLTARADDQTKLKALQSGATDFLTKPFSTTELLTRCKNLVALAVLSNRVSSQNQELRRNMEQIKESEVRMVQHAKMISLGRMSAGLIHEINNPLNYVMAAVRLLKRKHGDNLVESDREIFSDIDHGLKRVVDLVSNLRTFSHPNPRHFREVNLLDCVTQARRLTSPLEQTRSFVDIEIPPDIVVHGDEMQLSQVFINLLQNASDACNGHNPDSTPQIRIVAEKHSEEVIIQIRDNGPGIPDEIIDKIFDPFFTTKDVGSGMGLGLSICHAIIQSHAGRLDVQSELNRGTTVAVILPIQPPEALSQLEPEPAEDTHELIRL